MPSAEPITIVKDKLGDVTTQLLIMVAVRVELDAVLEVLQPRADRDAVLKCFWDESIYYIGRLGLYDVAVVMCDAGAGGRDGSIAAAMHAIGRFKPLGVVMVGVAFGRKPQPDKLTKQMFGDVLVSKSIIDYAPERIGPDGPIWRGTKVEADLGFINRTRNSRWTWASGGVDRRPQLGPILSGPKLYDNDTKVRLLLNQFGDAIGGEMEGAGVYSAANRNQKPWIVIKAVCDWGDGQKADDHQPMAARNATAFLLSLLSEPEFVPTAPPATQSELKLVTQEMRLETFRQEIRRRNDERQHSVEQLAALMEQFLDVDGVPRVPEGRRGEVTREKQRHDVVVEKWLNAYEDACLAALHGEVDIEAFDRVLGNEIRELFTIEGPHRRRLYPRESSPYDGLWRIHDSIQLR